MKRTEGLAKLTGRERYVDDLPAEGALWGMTVRSPAARGRIVDVRFDPAIDWSEFVIVDHTDIPGANEILLIERDQPVLAADRVRHVHEPVLLLAHESRDLARRAAAAVEVVVEPEPGVYDFRAAERAEPQHRDNNVLSRLTITKGDVGDALAHAPVVVAGVYETGAQEHVYLETQGMLASVDDGIVTITGSLQCPFYVVKALENALGAEHRVRVIQAATGGGFGGKEEFPSNVAIHAALLAIKAGRPVKLVYERGEDMAATTKRHPARVRIRTAHDTSGRLLAQDIDVLLDGGAYVTLSPVVLSRAIIHAGGPYSCEHVHIEGRAVLTNSVPYGAFRGFGAPQTLFAMERHMDRVARQLALDPVELRRRCLIRDGQSTSTGQIIIDGTDREAVLDRALELSRYAERRAAHADFNAAHPYLRRGVGLATFYHGAGFTGGGEDKLASELRIEGHADGSVEVLSANVEMGQGTLTVFTQLVCDRLGLDPHDVAIAQPDTSRVPDSGPTVASRTSMIVGHLVERAADDLRRRVGLSHDVTGEAVKSAIVEWRRTHADQSLVGVARYRRPPGVAWDDRTYKGDAYGTFAWAAYVAEVEVDLRTYDVAVTDFVAVQEIGRVLNETLARGQIQGGVAQALGWALMEDVVLDEGRMVNNQLTNYIIPTSDDLPPLRVDFLENPYEFGAQGAKGIGELPMDGPAPAVVNAIAAATGADPCAIPVTPERLLELLSPRSDGIGNSAA